MEQLVAACMGADRAALDLLLAGDGDLARRAAAAQPEALIRAARLGRLESVRLLVSLGFDSNTIRRTSALHEAAGRGDLPMVKLLIELGSDPAAVDGEFGATPLGWALHRGHDDVAEYLASRTPERLSSTE
jgi:ankyrin repeat protein